MVLVWYFTLQSPVVFSTVEDLLKMALALREIVLLLSLFISPLNGQIPKKEKFYAIKEDIPYIRCETCQKAVKYLYGKAHDMRGDVGATKRVSSQGHLHVGIIYKFVIPVLKVIITGNSISPVDETTGISKGDISVKDHMNANVVHLSILNLNN